MQKSATHGCLHWKLPVINFDFFIYSVCIMYARMRVTKKVGYNACVDLQCNPMRKCFGFSTLKRFCVIFCPRGAEIDPVFIYCYFSYHLLLAPRRKLLFQCTWQTPCDKWRHWNVLTFVFLDNYQIVLGLCRQLWYFMTSFHFVLFIQQPFASTFHF